MSNQQWGTRQNRVLGTDTYKNNIATITTENIAEYYKANGGLFGERGPEGVQGILGPTGYTGTTGPTGYTGPT